jgi:signal transduction histidine kinase
MKLNITIDPNKKRISILITYLIVGLCLITLFRWFENHTKLISQTKIQSEIIGNNISAAIIFKDLSAIQETIDSLSVDKNIQKACLFDENRKLITSYKKETSKDTCTSENPTFTSLIYITDIVSAGRKIGSLNITVSTLGIYIELLTFILITLVITAVIFFIARINSRSINRRIQQYEQSIKEMKARNELTLEDQHKRIAIEIHDQIGQLLTTSMLNLQIISKEATPETDKNALLNKTNGIINEAYLRIKDISASLHPSILKFGFIPAIEWLAEKSFSQYEINWQINTEGNFKEPEAKIALSLFRICQEIFSNVIKHSKARNVEILFVQTNKRLNMIILDDGIGFDVQSIESSQSLGLIGASERAKIIGANIEISSDIGQGTRVEIIV